MVVSGAGHQMALTQGKDHMLFAFSAINRRIGASCLK
jgi:hypothetical protein